MDRNGGCVDPCCFCSVTVDQAGHSTTLCGRSALCKGLDKVLLLSGPSSTAVSGQTEGVQNKELGCAPIGVSLYTQHCCPLKTFQYREPPIGTKHQFLVSLSSLSLFITWEIAFDSAFSFHGKIDVLGVCPVLGVKCLLYRWEVAGHDC